jgi:hypothetical protein
MYFIADREEVNDHPSEEAEPIEPQVQLHKIFNSDHEDSEDEKEDTMWKNPSCRKRIEFDVIEDDEDVRATPPKRRTLTEEHPVPPSTPASLANMGLQPARSPLVFSSTSLPRPSAPNATATATATSAAAATPSPSTPRTATVPNYRGAELHTGNFSIPAFNALVVITDVEKKSHFFTNRNKGQGSLAFFVDMSYTFVDGTNGRCTMWTSDYYGRADDDGWVGKVHVLIVLQLLFLSSTLQSLFSVFTSYKLNRYLRIIVLTLGTNETNF